MTFAQLTLWGGASPAVARLLDYILTEDWPEKTHFLWQFSSKVSEREKCLRLIPAALQLMDRGHTVEMWVAPAAPTYENTDPAKHEHIAGLYRDAFGRASRFDYCLSIEDDNIPQPKSLEQLMEHMHPSIAQIGGIYRIRGSPEWINASDSLECPWTPVLASSVLPVVMDTPMMGAGYTLYQGKALRRMRPVQCIVTPQPNGPAHVAGWDDWVGREFARLGYQSVSDGGVWVEHITPEVLRYLELHGLDR